MSLKVAIVGVSGEKLDNFEKEKAVLEIIKIGDRHKGCTIVSGHSPRGGIDILAEMYADFTKKDKLIFKPDTSDWEDEGEKKGYKTRNLEIAEACDILYCISVPMKEGGKSCYHCKQFTHEKTGGCWTMREAKKLGKKTKLIIL